jgi:hypothetical protein
MAQKIAELLKIKGNPTVLIYFFGVFGFCPVKVRHIARTKYTMLYINREKGSGGL